ncbi:MAG TPA: F0F1 ATP synthase subunit B' [Xanthobacteraceae bacterium]
MAATASTQKEGGPKAKGPFPPFAPEHFGAQLVWFAIAFGLLYLLLARYVLPRIASILEVRRARVASDLEEAGRLKGESEIAIAAYEKSLADARARAQAAVAEHQQKVAAETARRRTELEASLGQHLADAERKIEATRATAMKEVRGIAIEAAGAIVERLLGAPAAKPAVERAVDAALH